MGGSIGIAIEPRIVEVYRLCYEHSRVDDKRDAVLTDFVAYFPTLIFEADWLAKLVKKYGRAHDFEDGGPESRIFSALAKGFRKAGKPYRFRQHLRNSKLLGASIFRTVVHSELKEWDKSLERSSDPAREWVAERANQKTKELCERYPDLKRYQPGLEELLRLKHHYKASVLMASKVYRVRERDLQSTKSPISS
jgi:hypothetical protein